MRSDNIKISGSYITEDIVIDILWCGKSQDKELCVTSNNSHNINIHKFQLHKLPFSQNISAKADGKHNLLLEECLNHENHPNYRQHKSVS